MKKLLVLALGFALMACTAPVDTDDEMMDENVPAVEMEAEMMEEAVEMTEEATEEMVEEPIMTEEEALVE